MPSKQSTVRRLKTQPKPVKLKDSEIVRITEKLACALEHDSESIALVTMLFDQLEEARANYPDFFNIVYTVKKHLFIGTNAADDARAAFQTNAYANRGKLLLWPYERKEVV